MVAQHKGWQWRAGKNQVVLNVVELREIAQGVYLIVSDKEVSLEGRMGEWALFPQVLWYFVSTSSLPNTSLNSLA